MIAGLLPNARWTGGVHTDVVVGGSGMTVTGTRPNGTVDIIRGDDWVLPV